MFAPFIPRCTPPDTLYVSGHQMTNYRKLLPRALSGESRKMICVGKANGIDSNNTHGFVCSKVLGNASILFTYHSHVSSLHDLHGLPVVVLILFPS